MYHQPIGELLSKIDWKIVRIRTFDNISIIIIIIISFILIRNISFLSHIYRNRLYRPLTYKFNKT